MSRDAKTGVIRDKFGIEKGRRFRYEYIYSLNIYIYI